MALPDGGEVWSIDCEWGFNSGRVGYETSFQPVAFCAVGIRSKERHSFWGGGHGLASFIESHKNDLFVSHFNPAEMSFLIRLAIKLPARWFDTCIAWRHLTNSPGQLEASLIAALDGLDQPHISPEEKDDLRNAILHLNFDPDSSADRQKITDYCFKDCDDCAAVFERIADKVDPVVMRNWCEYLKAVAAMELRGIPVDVRRALSIHKLGPDILDYLREEVNKIHPLYVGGKFRRSAFFDWAEASGIKWPWRISDVTGRPTRSLDNDTLKSMEGHDPYIALVRQVRKTINSLGRRSIRMDGRSRRHYYSTWPFRSITGRNQPRDFIFCGPKWTRHLIVPESHDHVLVYADVEGEEIGIAAALSGDPAMREMYMASDPHIAFAEMAGAIPKGASKKTIRAIRRLYKICNLGSLYGMTEFGLAYRLGITRSEAGDILTQHKTLFEQYWKWSKRTVRLAYRRGRIRTKLGWTCAVPVNSNPRTFMNWPIQAAGGDLMRSIIIHLYHMNVKVLAPVHDGFLLSCREDQVDQLRVAFDKALELACRQNLDGFPLRSKSKVFSGRFQDEDGQELWRLINKALVDLGRARDGV